MGIAGHANRSNFAAIKTLEMKNVYLLSSMLACWSMISVCPASAQRQNADSAARPGAVRMEFQKIPRRRIRRNPVPIHDIRHEPLYEPVGATRDNRAEVSLPHAVFAFDYHFGRGWYLGTEIEFENGGTGATMEIEHNKEGGEIETEIEKGGEVALEQLHITKHFSNAFNLRIGHMIVPVGLTNSHHEPTLFFGTVRPESETAILPSTWHETGIAVLGYLGDFRYEAMLVSGLDPNGFSSENWIGSGRQKIFEVSKMTNPAVAARVEYSGIRNLRLAVSGYCGNTAKNSSKPYAMSGVKGTVAIGSFDAQYLGRNLIARANFVYGTVSDAKAIYDINRKYFNNTGYPITPFGKAAMAYGAEVGYDVLSWANTRNRLFRSSGGNTTTRGRKSTGARKSCRATSATCSPWASTTCRCATWSSSSTTRTAGSEATSTTAKTRSA